jgi:hypothetical protein
MSHENAASISYAIRTTLPEAGRAQVLYVSTDDPSPALFTSLKEVFPNLKTLCLDATHIAMVYEYATWSDDRHLYSM